MRRIQEKSPVVGYQLFRYARVLEDGTVVVSRKYYIRHKGKDTCTETDRLADAKATVKKMAGEEAQQHRRFTARPRPVTVGTLLNLVLDDYKESGNKTLKDAKSKIEHGLRPYFGEMIAERVDSETVEAWMRWRHTQRQRKRGNRDAAPMSPASINRELSLLLRGFKLGYRRKPQMVEKLPPIKKLVENNTRKGFITPEQYNSLLELLPPHLRPITCVAYHVANRKGELLNLEWSDVDLEGNPPVFTLWPGETKNKDGRTLPILEGEMLETLRELKRQRDEKWPNQRKVFTLSDGSPLQYHHMRKEWDNACLAAGLPGLLFHDLRRSAVRNLRRAGVTQKVAREFSGHKTDAVFDRYNITDFEDLRDAAGRLGKYLSAAKEKKGRE